MDTNEQIVELTLCGITKRVTIERFNDGAPWYVREPVLCKFPSGNKLHVLRLAAISNRTGKWTWHDTLTHALAAAKKHARSIGSSYVKILT